jgi:tetraacyldisaccharide 4'-kinase
MNKRRVLSLKGFVLSFLSYLLLPLSTLYYMIVKVRNGLYDFGFLSVNKLQGKVISVGNLTLGGTGKTPLVEYIAKALQNKGWKVALLSRGYARRERLPFAVVSDGKNILADVEKAGDEPLQMAKNLLGVIVVVDKNRYEAGLIAKEKYGVDLFILDDGYQHRKLVRDINILMIDGKNPFNTGLLFPAGKLREPISSIKRADAVVVSEPLSNNNEEIIKKIIMRYKAGLQFFHCYRHPIGLHMVKGDNPLIEGFFRSRKVISLAAIAQPAAFENDLRDMGFILAKTYRFSDHHYYTDEEIETIACSAKKLDAEAIITTQKDAVRLSHLKEVEPPIIYLKIEMKVREKKKFNTFLANSITS